MERVFHFSDFHISPEIGEPNKNSHFQLLLSSLSPYSNSQNYIVYTGDVIDASYVSKMVSEDEKFRAEQDSFTLAVQYFKDLQIKLGVSQDRVIFCLGNHDYKRSEITGAKDLCDEEINHDEEKYADAFASFCDFHKKLLGRDFYYGAHLYTVDSFNFFIANSVWREKYDRAKAATTATRKSEYSRCISCLNLMKALEDNENALLLKGSLEKNFFLIHDPSVSWCEEALFSYSRDAVREKLNALFGFRLCGDKHANAYLDDFYVIGNKLTSRKISYGIIEYNRTAKEYRRVTIDCTDNTIIMQPDRKLVSLVTSISAKYLKPKALSIVLKDEKVNKSQANKAILASEKIYRDEIGKDSRWIEINQLFEKIASYQIPGNGPGEKVTLCSNIFNKMFQDIVSDEGSTFCITVKGKPSRGKSIFLSIEYLYLLAQFKYGKLKYIPVYFNCETLSSKDYSEIVSEFNKFISFASELSKKENLPICFILDGFNQYNHYSEFFEEYVYDQYLSDIIADPNCAGGDVYILSIDSEDELPLEEFSFSRDRKSKRVIYLSDVETDGDKSTQAEAFIDIFCNLFDGYNAPEIKDNIRKLNLLGVDLNLLFHHGKTLSETTTPRLIEIYRNYFTRVVEKEDRDLAKKYAYSIRFEAKKYDGNISRKTFDVLLRQRELTCYLSAVSYCDEIITFSKSNKRIPKNSILNHFFNREQNLYINELLSAHRISKAAMEKFIREHFSKLQYSGKSQLIYLTSRIEEFSDIPINNSSLKKNLSDHTQSFYAKVASRSINIREARHNQEKMEKYITTLICDPNSRRLNRAVHLLYYADLSEREIVADFANNRDTILLGFDFFHTYLTLSSRIKEKIKQHSENDWIVYLDIFTLCDFIQQRIRAPIAKARKDEIYKESFFYTTKYNDASVISPKSILTNMCNILTAFTETYPLHRCELIDLYITQCMNDFSVCRSMYESGEGRIREGMFHAGKHLEELDHLSKTDRSGWKIPIVYTDKMGKETIDKMVNERASKESVLEHIYQTYLIGLLFLPDELPNNSTYEEYDKQTILNMVLIHDVGECITGDYPSFHPDYHKKKEEESAYNRSLFISGAFSSGANLTSYLQLWNEWETDKRNINVQIAHDLDIIQLIFKYYHLKKNEELSDFADDRCTQLEQEMQKVTTDIGRKILSKIVSENPYLFSRD